MKKVFIITGTARSGSTLLNLMIGNDQNGFSAGEIVALMRPWEKHHLPGKRQCFCGDEKCSFWNDIKRNGEKNVYSSIFESRKGVDFIVDSSKHLWWLLDQMEYARDKDYRIEPIVAYKTPLEFAYSREKRDKLPGWEKSWTSTYQRLLGYLNDFWAVNYANLAKNPAFTLERLCEKLDIPYFEGKERFWETNYSHFLFGSNTVKKSRKLIYYHRQYDPDTLERLKGQLPLHNQTFKNILNVLNAYEVTSMRKKDQSIQKLKHEIGNKDLLQTLKYRLRGTSSYSVNRMIIKLRELLPA